MKRPAAIGFLLSACLAWRSPGAEGREPRAITIKAFAFAPEEVRLTVGDTVAWTNHDMFIHTTAADSGAWTSAELRPGQRYVFVARRSGRFAYHCAAHPVMKALLIVNQ